MQGHILKYKDKDGNWINIPFTASDIYTLYCLYCKEHGVEPVSQADYYISVGALSTLVAQLGSNATHLQDIAKSLENGALPVALGGTGLVLSDHANILEYLLDPDRGPGIATESYVADKIVDYNESTGKFKLDVKDIVADTRHPEETQWRDEERPKYYFQIEQ